MRRLLVLVISGLLLLAACGSSGSDSAGTTTTTTEPGTPADRRLARAGLLRSGDLPGFQQVSASPSEAADLPALAVGFSECKRFIEAIRVESVQGRSPGFQRGSAVVNSSVAVYDNDTDAAAEIDAWRVADIPACLQKVYEKGLHDGTVSVSPIAINDVGDQTFGFRITITGTGGGARTADIVGVRVGRTLFTLNIAGTTAESAEVQTVALPELIDRLRSAAG